MTFLPVIPWPFLIALALAGLAAVWWNPSERSAMGESKATHWRLTAAVALLFVAASRPAVPGEQVDTTAANVNVYFVVDTTSSIIAEDYGKGKTRLNGVQDDIVSIANSLPGARYSVITFDGTSRVRLPLTTDTLALEAALETLIPESAENSQGSSITGANERLSTLLTQADKNTPDRGKVVFYFGDGEQTAANAPAPFTVNQKLIDGGAVLGYGTTAGGRMKATRSRYSSDQSYIQDPATGTDAKSVINVDNLKAIAGQLGVPFVLRNDGDSIAPAVDGIDLKSFGQSEQIEKEKIRARKEFYWPFLIGVAAIAAWEIGASLSGLVQTRRRREAAP